ncbi:ExeM/NucH family extracellular endonuclease [Aliidiomarina quisquiliarum]|uniref:ExeM/NucH family extracellular endonuclease n=1 Tax=Aliidiomarina quisquiliarum TaxID=2938947 RepID=UPI00208DEA77|nr:ExeM/NucH family extracellular endonuclease [Aliidiomarina quisquiliarum]MCO4320223.1 ExeM/NucH family extracellular endonuclease [Aliidiomarina quisquiliarum]
MALKYGSLAALLVVLLTGCGSSDDVFGGGGDGGGDTGGDGGSTGNLSCSAATLPITSIQGTGASSPKLGETVTVSGVVHAEFLGAKRLNGFYIQANKANFDNAATASQGLFIHHPAQTTIRIGQEVVVRGVVQESNGNTQIGAVEAIAACKTGNTIVYSDIKFPIDSIASLDRYEGMAVRLAGVEYVTDHENLAEEGELLLATEVLSYPTEVMAPGSAANTYAERYKLMSLVLDDGSFVENPESVIYPAPELLSYNPVRIGDRVLGLQGVLAKKDGVYRLHPSEVPTFVPTNHRPAKPKVGEVEGVDEPPRDANEFRVATINLWQYIPGTHSFSRQRPKIQALFSGLDADVYVLQELPNNGTGPASGIVDLVNMLNEAEEGTPYAFVEFAAGPLGNDDETNGIVYRQDRVSQAGVAAALTSGHFNGDLNQPAVAQTFTHIVSGKGFTVVGNQFAERDCDDDNNASELLKNHGDGQACASLARREATQTLLNWLATNPTGNSAAPVVIAGDFNAYTLEDPARLIKAAGYFNAAETLAVKPYTTVEEGMVGSLDHIFVASSIRNAVVAADTWKVNADEPEAFNYEINGKTYRHQNVWYQEDMYRSVERNPVVIAVDTGLIN